MRAKLEKAAAESSHSVSEEIERRVEKSFDEVDSIRRFFRSNDLFLLAKMAASAGEVVEARTGKPWHADESNLELTIGHITAQLKAAAMNLSAFAEKEAAHERMIDNNRFAYKGEPVASPAAVPYEPASFEHEVVKYHKPPRAAAAKVKQRDEAK
jgi:hypothetical protein